MSSVSSVKTGVKNKVKQEKEEVKIPKKRGRKPKKKVNEENKEEKKEVMNGDTESPTTPVKKKRGKKKVEKILDGKKAETKKNEPDAIIVQLPIRFSDLNIDTSQAESETVDSEVVTSEKKVIFFGNESQDDEIVLEEQSSPEVDNDSDDVFSQMYTKRKKKGNSELSKLKKELETYKKEVARLKKQIEDDNQHQEVNFQNIKFIRENKEGKEVAENLKDVCCMWDTEPFTGTPWGIPYKYYQDTFYIFGYFSSPQCALAYSENMKDYAAGERRSLLNHMYHLLTGDTEPLKPADDREVLKKFGGTVEIEDFRKHHKHSYRYILPPMTSIAPLIEKDGIIDYQTRKKVPVTRNLIENAKQNLRLQRQKPLKNGPSLRDVMKIKRK